MPGTGSGPGNAYNPLYPFGYGPSYTTFPTTNLAVTPTVARRGTGTVTFTVTNTGSRSGTDIVQLDNNDTTPYDVDGSAPFTIS